MQITRIKLKNWRNFREAEANNLADVAYILGPNASGKSNFLDALRFLRDIARPKGGGLQAAIESRGGMKKIRCLHARKDTEVLIEIDLSEQESQLSWTYAVSFNLPAKGHREPEITREYVEKHIGNGKKQTILERPNTDDKQDPARRRETHIEQISANSKFRELAIFFGGITYVHLVPQLLKFGDQIGGRVLEEDPFGQEFMLRISRTQSRTRDARLKRIENALRSIVPHLENLQFVKDEVTGQPHLEIRFKHHRPHGARQREDQFSDGTLRLISLLWLLQEGGDSPLLLEEPELSLNEEIVAQLPDAIHRTKKKSRSQRQVFITTHSQSLLSNSGIDSRGIIIVEPSTEGSTVRSINPSEQIALSAGLSPAEAVLPAARKFSRNDQLRLSL